MRKKSLLLMLIFINLLAGCQNESNNVATPDFEEGQYENITEIGTKDKEIETKETETEEIEEVSEETGQSNAPTKEQVLAAREIVCEGMTEEQAARLKENIKLANYAMEHGYLYDNIFEKLEDKDSLYWNYFDQKGDIQIGWRYDMEDTERRKIMQEESLSMQEFLEKYGTPVMVYNRFDADNFINLIEEMQGSVQNEALKQDLQNLIDETKLARDTHEMEHANNIYKILHDMDYFLLRYGIEDVGKYTKDSSTISKYYNVLTIYQE